MPHAEIDVSCDTEVEFTIPYSSTLNFCPTKIFSTGGPDYGSLGQIQIFPYSKLAAVAGSTTANYTMYFSMKNIKLFGATVPQSRNFGAKRKGKSNQAIEQNSNGMGPISSALATTSQSLAILGDIPLISSYAKTTAWFTDRMSKAASVFGLSKPVNLEHPMRMTPNFFNYIASTDGPDQSQPLALSYKNEVDINAVASTTDFDEMDFKFITSIPAYLQTNEWSTSTAVGTQILSLSVVPQLAPAPTTINSTTVITDTPLSFVSRHFKYWRGSMVFRFKFVRTEFHSGRLAFSFTPSFTDAAAAVTPTYVRLSMYIEILLIFENTQK